MAAAGGKVSAGKWKEQPWGHRSDVQSTVSASAQSSCLDNVHLSHHPTCQRAWHHFLPLLPVFSACLRGLSSSPSYAQHQAHHNTDGAAEEMERSTVCCSPSALTWLVPASLVRLTQILCFTVPIPSVVCCGVSVALLQIQHSSQARQLWQAQSNPSWALLSGRSWQFGVRFGSSCINGTWHLVNSRHRSSGRFSDQATPAALWGKIHSVCLHLHVLYSCSRCPLFTGNTEAHKLGRSVFPYHRGRFPIPTIVLELALKFQSLFI